MLASAIASFSVLTVLTSVASTALESPSPESNECTTMSYGSSYTFSQDIGVECSALAEMGIDLSSGCACVDDPITITNGPGQCGCMITEGGHVTYIPPSNARLSTDCRDMLQGCEVRNRKSEPGCCTTMAYGSSYTINLESMEADCSVLAQIESIELGSGCVCADDPVTISNGPGACGCTIIEEGGRVVTYIPPSNARLGTTCMHISDNPCDSLSSEEIENVDASIEEEASTAVEEGTVSTAVEEDEESTAPQPESNEGVNFMSPSDEFLTDIPETVTPASLEVDASKAASSELTGYLFALVFVLV